MNLLLASVPEPRRFSWRRLGRGVLWRGRRRGRRSFRQAPRKLLRPLRFYFWPPPTLHPDRRDIPLDFAARPTLFLTKPQEAIPYYWKLRLAPFLTDYTKPPLLPIEVAQPERDDVTRAQTGLYLQEQHGAIAQRHGAGAIAGFEAAIRNAVNSD
jgi:hypothetical protein